MPSSEIVGIVDSGLRNISAYSVGEARFPMVSCGLGVQLIVVLGWNVLIPRCLMPDLGKETFRGADKTQPFRTSWIVLLKRICATFLVEPKAAVKVNGEQNEWRFLCCRDSTPASATSAQLLEAGGSYFCGLSQSIVISRSTCLNSGSPVSSTASFCFVRAAAKQSAYAIRCLDLYFAAS